MRGCLIFFLFALALLTLQCARINYEIAGRPERALKEHYAGQQILIENTEDLRTMQKCFEFRLSDPRAGFTTSKIAMVEGDADERWEFSAEYKTMAECRADVNHG